MNACFKTLLLTRSQAHSQIINIDLNLQMIIIGYNILKVEE